MSPWSKFKERFTRDFGGMLTLSLILIAFRLVYKKDMSFVETVRAALEPSTMAYIAVLAVPLAVALSSLVSVAAMAFEALHGIIPRIVIRVLTALFLAFMALTLVWAVYIFYISPR